MSELRLQPRKTLIERIRASDDVAVQQAGRELEFSMRVDILPRDFGDVRFIVIKVLAEVLHHCFVPSAVIVAIKHADPAFHLIRVPRSASIDRKHLPPKIDTTRGIYKPDLLFYALQVCAE